MIPIIFGSGSRSVLLVLLAFLSTGVFSASIDDPQLPHVFVDTEPVPITGKIISVSARGNLNRALQRAQPGDVIELEPGAVYRGPFVLPARESDSWIVIRTAGIDDHLPSGERAELEHVNHMAVLEANGGSVISAQPGAGYYRLTGLKIRPSAGTFLYNLVLLGDDAETREQLPHHIIFDRCILQGDPDMGTRRGIAMNSRHTAVINSHLSQFMEVGADSQAIASWNGEGPFKISNNYLEGAGENIMFGGGVAKIPDLVPADIEIRGNHFYKPMSWKSDHPDYAGTQWTIKHLLELKNARRVLMEGNVLEYNWAQARTGFAVLLTVRDEDGQMPWAVVEDITMINNVIRHAGNGINILGRDGSRRGGQTRRILIANNLFEDIGGEWGGGRLFQMLEGTRDVTIRNNTAGQTGTIIMSDGEAHQGFVFENNVVPHNEYGIVGSGTAFGMSSLLRHFPEALVRNNVIIGGNRSSYPFDNHFPRSAKWADIDGTGVDMTLLCGALKTNGSTKKLVPHCS